MVFLLIVLILFAIASLIAVISLFNLQTLPPNDIFPPPASDIQCSPDQVLTAWIWNTPSNGICPDYTNQLVVSSGNLYERQFMIDPNTGCCWFSKDESQRLLVPNAYILTGSKTSKSYTDDQLNQKPYAVIGNTIVYVVPFCDNDDDCFEMLLVGMSGNIGAYKISKYYDVSDISDPATIDYIQNSVFYISNDGQTLLDIQYKGQSIYTGCSVPPGAPLVISYVVKLFCEGRMFPVAGLNNIGASSL